MTFPLCQLAAYQFSGISGVRGKPAGRREMSLLHSGLLAVHSAASQQQFFTLAKTDTPDSMFLFSSLFQNQNQFQPYPSEVPKQNGQGPLLRAL